MRRRFIALLGLLIGSLGTGCGGGPAGPSDGDARLRTQPSQPETPLPPGRHPLSGNRGFFYLPEGGEPGEPVPLLVLLHGAGGRSGDWEAALSLADSVGMALLVPDATGYTWDALQRGFGPDVQAIDAALEEVFAHAWLDSSRLGLGGFSDGASYALSLGLVNGDLFTHLVAFSPGLVRTPARTGRPVIYVTHGIADRVLSIDETSRDIVSALRNDGYDVTFEEFDGGHIIPREVGRRVFEWVVEDG